MSIENIDSVYVSYAHIVKGGSGHAINQGALVINNACVLIVLLLS